MCRRGVSYWTAYCSTLANGLMGNDAYDGGAGIRGIKCIIMGHGMTGHDTNDGVDGIKWSVLIIIHGSIAKGFGADFASN